jgi:hypothetical protein
MRKITKAYVLSVLFVVAAVLTVSFLSGCSTKQKAARTPFRSSAAGIFPVDAYGGDSTHNDDLILAKLPGFMPKLGTPSTGGEVWIIARNKNRAVPGEDARGSGALITKVSLKSAGRKFRFRSSTQKSAPSFRAL